MARCAIVEGLGSDQFRRDYGFEIRFSAKQAEQWIADATGDLLDSVLCTVQAAWAWSQRNRAFGIPENVDPLEGWIPDPGLLLLAGY